MAPTPGWPPLTDVAPSSWPLRAPAVAAAVAAVALPVVLLPALPLVVVHEVRRRLALLLRAPHHAILRRLRWPVQPRVAAVCRLGVARVLPVLPVPPWNWCICWLMPVPM